MNEKITLDTQIARRSDIFALFDIINSAYCSGEACVTWKNPPGQTGGERISIEELEEVITSETKQLLVVRNTQDEPVACVLVELDSAGDAMFGMLSVSPGCQNQGLGRRLIRLAEMYAQQWFHAPVIRAHVIPERDELIAWYERLGYTKSPVCVPFSEKDSAQIKTASRLFAEIYKPLAAVQGEPTAIPQRLRG